MGYCLCLNFGVYLSKGRLAIWGNGGFMGEWRGEIIKKVSCFIGREVVFKGLRGGRGNSMLICVHKSLKFCKLNA